MTQIDVVAGIIFSSDGGQVLLALRKPDQHQGDRWEFPGGKQEPDESLRSALQRELFEEIGINVIDCSSSSIVEHEYPEKKVRLHFWDVTRFSGEPRGREGQELRWVELAELSTLRFPDANQSTVDALVGRG